MSIHDENKAWFGELRAALYDIGPAHLRRTLTQFFAPDAQIAFCYAFCALVGPEALFDQVYAPLIAAMPDMERRDFIFMAGARRGPGTPGDWIGVGGNIVGRFDAPWLGIPPTGRPVFLRYHEYYRVEARQTVEMTALWDIPQLMVQADAWPFAPQTGVEWMCPGPADGQGIKLGPHDATAGDASVQLVWDMLHDLQRGDADAPLRAAEGYWPRSVCGTGPPGLAQVGDQRDFRTWF